MEELMTPGHFLLARHRCGLERANHCAPETVPEEGEGLTAGTCESSRWRSHPGLARGDAALD